MNASYEEIKKFYGKSTKSDHTENWNGLEVRLHPTLTLEESLKFVHEVVYSCFEANTGEYLPEIKDFAVKCSVLETHGNIELPESAEEKHELVYNTDLYDFVLSRINTEQFDELKLAVESKINHLTNSRAAEMEKRLDKALSDIEDLLKSVSDIFGEVDKDELMKLLKSISDVGFDEKKLVEAFIEVANENGNKN